MLEVTPKRASCSWILIPIWPNLSDPCPFQEAIFSRTYIYQYTKKLFLFLYQVCNGYAALLVKWPKSRKIGISDANFDLSAKKFLFPFFREITPQTKIPLYSLPGSITNYFALFNLTKKCLHVSFLWRCDVRLLTYHIGEIQTFKEMGIWN